MNWWAHYHKIFYGYSDCSVLSIHFRRGNHQMACDRCVRKTFYSDTNSLNAFQNFDYQSFSVSDIVCADEICSRILEQFESLHINLILYCLSTANWYFFSWSNVVAHSRSTFIIKQNGRSIYVLFRSYYEVGKCSSRKVIFKFCRFIFFLAFHIFFRLAVPKGRTTTLE